MFRKDLYQFVLLVGFFISTYWLKWSRGDQCVNKEDLYKYPKAPAIAIYISEFQDNDEVMPIGYNLTIACTGNSSKEGYSWFSEQPFLVQLFFKSRSVKMCGGTYSDREDSKTCKLHIKEATRNDSGEYGCMVFNSMRCSIAALTLNLREPMKPRFEIHPISQDNIVKGEKAKFSCKALGIPRPVISWFKDGRKLPKDGIKVTRALSELTIESVHPQDKGQYWCEAKSGEGWSRSAVANLTVIWKPIFYIHPVEVAVEEGNDAIFKCAANGSSRPEISWLKNNSLLLNPTLVKNGSISYLVLHSVTKRQNHGMYKCVAMNRAGRTSSWAGRLTVVSKEVTIPTRNTSQRIANVDDNSSSRTLTIILALVGSVITVIMMVSVLLILRRFWCREEIIKPCAEKAGGQAEFLLIDNNPRYTGTPA